MAMKQLIPGSVFAKTVAASIARLRVMGSLRGVRARPEKLHPQRCQLFVIGRIVRSAVLDIGHLDNLPVTLRDGSNRRPQR